jgi:malic enzyme
LAARRLRGSEYLELVDEFVAAVRAVMPDALVQWEDFRKDNALAILDRYVDALPSFNDDIQGTGAVVMAGLNSALKIKGERLPTSAILIYGAGAAGLGVTRQIKTQLAEEGVNAERRAAVVAVLDRSGLVIDDGRIRDPYKRELSWPAALAQARVRRQAKAVAARSRAQMAPYDVDRPVRGDHAFDERLVREMAAHVARPVIFPSSNPSANSEAHRRPLRVDGLPLPRRDRQPVRDVECGGKRFRVGQGNNVFIFPGLGLGALAVRARKVTNGMANAASKTLAALVTADERDVGLLFPSVTRLRSVSYAVAVAVGARSDTRRCRDDRRRRDRAGGETKHVGPGLPELRAALTVPKRDRIARAGVVPVGTDVCWFLKLCPIRVICMKYTVR